MDNLYIVIFKTSQSILGYRPSEYKLHSFRAHSHRPHPFPAWSILQKSYLRTVQMWKVPTTATYFSQKLASFVHFHSELLLLAQPLPV